MKEIDYELPTDWREFYSECRENEEVSDLPRDAKHVGINELAEKMLADLTIANFRNWSGQSDLAVPFISDVKNIFSRDLGDNARSFFNFLKNPLANNILLQSYRDDLSIIHKCGYSGILSECPVSFSPGANQHCWLEGYNINLRWMRYVYLAGVILDKIKFNGGIWVDVGSYYGGLQGIVRKYSEGTFVLVDFPHQLLRSYIYLKNLYRDDQFLRPVQSEKFLRSPQSETGVTFCFLTPSAFEKLTNHQVDLFTNFFSLGEMPRDVALNYMKSEVFRKAKHRFLVNRFVSAPFFEKTYDTSLSVLDYQLPYYPESFYFDVFPMHHFLQIRRDLLGSTRARNTSSSYFEYRD